MIYLYLPELAASYNDLLTIRRPFISRHRLSSRPLHPISSAVFLPTSLDGGADPKGVRFGSLQNARRTTNCKLAA